MAAKAPSAGIERRLYIWMGILAALVVFAGFARTYYLKELTGTPPLTSLVHMHGLVMTVWFLLFFVQSTLVARRQVALHRRLGLAGGILAALMIVVGLATGIEAARLGRTPGPPPLVFLAIPMFDILVFGVLVGTAFYYRSKRQIHSRLMLLASLAILTPAIARIPFLASTGLLGFFGITDVIILSCVAFDTIKNRRLHPAFAWGTAFVVVSQVGRFAIAGTDAWIRFATWLVS